MVPYALRVYDIVLCLDAHVHIHIGALEITLFRFRRRAFPMQWPIAHASGILSY